MPDNARYGAVAQALHWVMAVLVLVAFLYGPGGSEERVYSAARASKSVQMVLYLLMLALPVTAVAGAWLEGHPLTFVGGVEIAPRLARSHDLGAGIATVHTWLGDAILWLAGFHALAGLYHHFVLRDGVLLSMLPRWPR